MDRDDLLKARAALPNLEPIWQHRRVSLEAERDHVVAKLDQHLEQAAQQDDKHMANVCRALIRIDRSLWFLDRALMHLDDLDRPSSYAARIPLDMRPQRNT